MSFAHAFRFVIALFFAVVIGRRFADRCRVDTDEGKERWKPVWHPMYLVIFFGATLSASAMLGWRGRLWQNRLSFIEVLLTTALYFALLLPALPLLRRRYSARACAALWLLPNLLYIRVFDGGAFQGRPLLMLPLRVKPDWLLWVWMAGAAAVFAWKVAQHVRFRRMLLDGAYEPDAETLALWQEARKEIEDEETLEKPLPLLLSPHTATPLSIGVWRSALRVVLPERSYTPDELRLIFRHELIHIARQDAETKLFLAVCTAVMWWNPLMWIAARRCADDLELGCDEFVLADEPAEERARYAGLLLKTAGDERGFTTCLSATAEALRYRLENVLHPRQKRLGALLLGVVTAALILSSGAVVVGHSPQRLGDVIYHGADDGAQTVTDLYLRRRGEESSTKQESGALWETLRTREVWQLAGNCTLEPDVVLDGESGDLWYTLDCAGPYVQLTIHRLKEDGYLSRISNRCYRFAETPDWDALLAEAD